MLKPVDSFLSITAQAVATLGTLSLVVSGCCVSPALRITNRTAESVTMALGSRPGSTVVVAPARSAVFPLFYDGAITVGSTSRGPLRYSRIRSFDYTGRTTSSWFTSDFPCSRVYSYATLNADWSMSYPPIHETPNRAIQRTGSAVTPAAASHPPPSPMRTGSGRASSAGR